MTEEKSTQDILDHLDLHIREWRKDFDLPDGRQRQRGIDVVDALQLFRQQVFGGLLAQDDGTFGVISRDGKTRYAFATEAEVTAILEASGTESCSPDSGEEA